MNQFYVMNLLVMLHSLPRPSPRTPRPHALYIDKVDDDLARRSTPPPRVDDFFSPSFSPLITCTGAHPLPNYIPIENFMWAILGSISVRIQEQGMVRCK